MALAKEKEKQEQLDALRAINAASNKIAVIQWYSKSLTEEILEKKLTNKQYQKIVRYIAEHINFDSEVYKEAVVDILKNKNLI